MTGPGLNARFLTVALAIAAALLHLGSAHAAPTPLTPLEIEPNVNLWGVLGWAALNPAVVAVAWAMGRQAHGTTQRGIAAFAGAIAGIALLWLAAWLHLSIATDTARAGAGVFMTALPFGVLWAWAAHRLQPAH